MAILDVVKSVLGRGKANALTSEYDRWQVRAAWERFIIGQYLENPDFVIKKHAGSKGLGFYDEMMTVDPVIGSCVETRKLSLMSHEWTIAANDAPEEIVNLCWQGVNNIANFHGDLLELFDALPKGFSVSEIMWEVNGGRWLPRELRSRDQDNYVFDADNHLRLLTQNEPTDGEEVPPYKFILYAHNRKHEDPHGQSILQRCYWPYWFKKNAWKFWAISVERLGMPVIIAAVNNSLTDEDRAKVEAFLAAVQSESWAIKPETIELDTLESKRNFTAEFHGPFMDYADKMARLAILGQTLTTEQGTPGSFALGKVHERVRLEYTAADAKESGYVLSDQLLRPIVVLNRLSYTGPIPMFEWNIDPGTDLNKQIEIDDKAQKMGYPMTYQYMHDTYGYPLPKEGEPEDIMKARSTPSPFGAGESVEAFADVGTRRKIERLGRERSAILFADWPDRLKKKSKR